LDELEEKLAKLKTAIEARGLDASSFFHEVGLDIAMDEGGVRSIRPFCIPQESTVRFVMAPDPAFADDSHDIAKDGGKDQDGDNAPDDTMAMDMSETQTDHNVQGVRARRDAVSLSVIQSVPEAPSFSFGSAPSSSLGIASFETCTSQEEPALPTMQHNDDEDDDEDDDVEEPTPILPIFSKSSDMASRSGDGGDNAPDLRSSSGESPV